MLKSNWNNFGADMHAPCMTCTKRHAACWDSCDLYIAYKKRVREATKNRRKYMDEGGNRYKSGNQWNR